MWAAASPSPAQMWLAVSRVPAQMWPTVNSIFFWAFAGTERCSSTTSSTRHATAASMRHAIYMLYFAFDAPCCIDNLIRKQLFKPPRKCAPCVPEML